MAPSISFVFRKIQANSPWLRSTRKPAYSTNRPSSTINCVSEKYGDPIKVLGEGATGRVFLLQHSDERFYAVKQLRGRHPNERMQQYASAVGMELRLGPSLDHQNIIQTLELLHDSGVWFKVMEYVPRDLFSIAMQSKMQSSVVDCLFVQILHAITYLHGMGFAHRDLKLENVVVTEDGIAKLIDFGSAWDMGQGNGRHLAAGNVGSAPYVAPEVLKRPYNAAAADIWSLAIIYCCMSMKSFPWFLASETDEKFRKFISPEPKTEVIDEKPALVSRPRTGPQHLLMCLPVEARPIIWKMLNIYPASRATLSEIWKDRWVDSIERCSMDGYGVFTGASNHSH